MGLILAMVVPIIFMLCGAVGRKLAGKSGWHRKYFYLGVELALAAFSANVLYLAELARANPADGRRALTAAISVVVIFFIYLFLLSLHQDWEAQDHNARGQYVRLVVFSNIVGTGLFALFVFVVKGVR